MTTPTDLVVEDFQVDIGEDNRVVRYLGNHQDTSSVDCTLPAAVNGTLG